MTRTEPRLRQLRDCANGIAVRHMNRAKTLGFRHMFLSVNDPADPHDRGVEAPVICIAHGINAEIQSQWAAARYQQDPLHRMKARGDFASRGNQPLLWENHQGRITLSNGSPKLTSIEVDTMRWVYGYGMRTGVNICPGEIDGREVCISFYSGQPRGDIAGLDDAVAILFYLAHMIASDVKQELTREMTSHQVRLTRRETQCLHWVAAGKNSREICAILGLSVQTVRDHMKRVRSKLNSTTLAQALMRASTLGLIVAPNQARHPSQITTGAGP
jgi:DNA-binding CsgD family transcriptional regulator